MDAFDQWVEQSTRQYRRVRNEPDDARLIDEARTGGQAATSELQSRHGREIEERLSRLDRLCAEHATELVNEVFVRLPTLLEHYEHSDRFELFLFKCAYNRWLTLRRSIHRNPVVAVDPATLHASVDFSAVTRIDLEMLRSRAEAMLTETELEALRLSVEGFSPAQIGQVLDISAGAASTRLNRARARLRDLMSRYLDAGQGPGI